MKKEKMCINIGEHRKIWHPGSNLKKEHSMENYGISSLRFLHPDSEFGNRYISSRSIYMLYYNTLLLYYILYLNLPHNVQPMFDALRRLENRIWATARDEMETNQLIFGTNLGTCDRHISTTARTASPKNTTSTHCLLRVRHFSINKYLRGANGEP